MTGLPETLARPYDLFGRLAKVPADALLGLIALYRADAPPDKIDLGVGVFRDDGGATPVMRAVKSAEAEILATQISKSYLGAEGDARYTELLAKIALGEKLACSPRITGVQTPGGTGALRLGAEFVKRAAPDATVWIGEPTWPNHGPIFLEAGLRVKAHRFYDVAAAAVDIDAMIEDLGAAAPGDILLLHGCCHNPTGAELDAEAWQRIATLCEERQLTPFVDLAYQGLGNGLEADAGPTRALFAALPAAILAYSCDKNFGLYRERVGALWIQGPEGADLEAARGNILALARSLWSMPPDHGAAIVRVIPMMPRCEPSGTRSSMRCASGSIFCAGSSRRPIPSSPSSASSAGCSPCSPSLLTPSRRCGATMASTWRATGASTSPDSPKPMSRGSSRASHPISNLAKACI